MTRFQSEKSTDGKYGLRLSLVFLLLILLLFARGVNRLSRDTIRRQEDTLRAALNRSVTRCYAIEGAYPENLQYLKEHYGITYDEELFFVDYRVSGANIFPDITIIKKEP